MDDKQIERVARQLRAYLTERPRSADTLEGIHHFWLVAEATGTQAPIAATLEALCRLESEGFLERRAIGKTWVWRRPIPR